MHYIDRSALSSPELLQSKEADRARQEVQHFLSETTSKGATRRTPSSIWMKGNKKFHNDVRSAFGNVCVYCERSTRTTNGLISHHRPESLAQDQSGNTDLTAYAWLMYEWENVIWICEKCERLKKNKFWIRGRRGEIGSSVGVLRKSENVRMIDPCFHFPSEHFSFDLDGSVSPSSSLGKASISLLDLNSMDLKRSRHARIQKLIDGLSKNQDRFPVSSTSSEQTLDSGIFTGPVEPTKKQVIQSSEHFEMELPPHSGSATLVLLKIGNLVGMECNSAYEFRSRLNAAFIKKIRNLWNDYQDRKSSLKEPDDKPAQPASKPSPVQKDRTPALRHFANGLSAISKVEISNFKTLRNITFELPTVVADPEQSPCMILLGENGTGKSSVLEAMTLAVIGSNEAGELDELLKDEDLSPAELIHRPDPSKWDKPNSKLDIRMHFVDATEHVHLHAKKGHKRFSGTPSCCKVVLGYGPRRYFTNRKTRRYRAPAQRVRSLFDPLNMIANPIHWLSSLDGDSFYAAARALREILMLDNEDDFERDDDANTRGQIFIRQNGQRTALKDLSVGYKSVIAMASDIIRELLYYFDNVEFAHAVVFIDEIETHLHPRWKLQIMQLLRKAFPKVQFIVTTHDPLCLRGMYEGEVFVLQRDQKNAQVQQIEDLPSIRGMRAEQILTSEFFGLGSTDPETDAQLARYNILATRIEGLEDHEKMEMDELRVQLDENMMIGSTIAEQAYAEALKEQVKVRVNPTKVASPRRKNLETRFAALLKRDR